MSPIIPYCSDNELSKAFGFLASQEVKNAGVGNLGLQDRTFTSGIAKRSDNLLKRWCLEREALRWIQKYIGAFGGDPTKVTMCVTSIFMPLFCAQRYDSWGESAGAISVALQMVTNGGDTEGLFRGAFMESGSPIPVGDITHGQPYYDTLVNLTGCSDASDTLQCLRGVPYDTLMDAIDTTPNIFSYQAR